MNHSRTCLATALICLFMGCTGLPSNHPSTASSLLRGNPQQIRERLLSEIPIGTTRTDAMRIAMSLGLDSAPPTFGLNEDNSLRFQNEGKHGWFGQKISLIQIECSQGVVEDISCEQIGTH